SRASSRSMSPISSATATSRRFTPLQFARRFLLVSYHPRRPGQHGNSDHDAIYGERCEAAPADIAHEPGDGSVGDDEGDDEADGEDDPLVMCDLGDANGIFVLAAVDRFEERV